MDLYKLQKQIMSKPALTSQDKNQLASIYIHLEQYNLAYGLLLNNYQQNPSLYSINNLAWYFIFVGELGDDGRLYPNYNRAIELLLTLESHDTQMYVPYTLLGYAYVYKNDEKNALRYFEKAYFINQIPTTQINYAIALCHNGDYAKATKYFQVVSELKENNYYLRYCYIFCKYLAYQEKVPSKEIEDMIKRASQYPGNEPNLIDICCLLFLYEDYESVIKLYDLAMDDYTIEPKDFWLIAHSLLKRKSINLIGKYYDLILDDYTTSYFEPLKEKIEKLNLIYNKKFYMDKPQIVLRKPIDNSCYFFGCVIHD